MEELKAMFRKIKLILLAHETGKLIRNYQELNSLMNGSDFLVVTYLNPHVMKSIILDELISCPEWYFVVDGVYVAWLFSILTGEKFRPLNIDDSGIAKQLILEMNSNNEVPLFMGGTEFEAATFLMHQSQMGASVKCVDGYSRQSSQKFLESDAKFKFVSFGSPLQERFIMEHMDELALTSKVVFSCGGFVGQFSRGFGAVYPKFINKLNIRFLYRIFSESGTFRRILSGYIPFFLSSLVFWLLRLVLAFKSLVLAMRNQ